MAHQQTVASTLKKLRALNIPTRPLCTVPRPTPSPGSPREPTPPTPSHTPTETPARPSSVEALFAMQSKRRVAGSPILPLEAVAVPALVQTSIERALAASKLTPRLVRKSAKILDSVVAPETAHDKRKRKRGKPSVRPPPEYGVAEAVSYAVVRAPGTLATNIYIMSEVRRRLGDFTPRSVLDFGAGIGVSVMAAARVFNEDPFDAGAEYLQQLQKAEAESEATDESKEIESLPEGGGRSFINEALLVDHSKTLRSMASEILSADVKVAPAIKISKSASLRDAPHIPGGHDLVCASYSLNEVVREAMANPTKVAEGEITTESVNRGERLKLAEKRLKRAIKALWSRTAPGGLLIVVEDGTAAGFETVLFARDTILRLTSESGKLEEQASGSGLPDNSTEPFEDDPSSEQKRSVTIPIPGARVIAPCMHSKACPLRGSITPHRVCRFIQRFNRPAFLRNTRQTHAGYQDEYFSYIAIQKLPAEGANTVQKAGDLQTEAWGRLVRAPLRKGKHVVLDVCTTEGELERRVVSKKNALKGHYSRARRSKWGDIWPVTPSSEPQPVNF